MFDFCNPLSKVSFLGITCCLFWKSPFGGNERLDTCEFIKPLVEAQIPFPPVTIETSHVLDSNATSTNLNVISTHMFDNA